MPSRETAPANFVRQDDEGYSYVTAQPTTPSEEAACLAAMEECPVEAIGFDGEVRPHRIEGRVKYSYRLVVRVPFDLRLR